MLLCFHREEISQKLMKNNVFKWSKAWLFLYHLHIYNLEKPKTYAPKKRKIKLLNLVVGRLLGQI